MARIILCMIVKNESGVMRRCLAGALPVIDAACICDTGSSDGTPELVEEVLEDSGIPHHIRRHEWVNFGVNRGRSITEARCFAKQLGWDLTDSYALLLDADMALRISDEFDPANLTADSYSLRQLQGTLIYANVRLAKLVLDWRSIGATHEYWSADGAGPVEILDTLWIEDLGDGGSKGDKHERDMRLLEAELKDQPDSPRTQFYLAQTYFETGRFEEARALYTRRVEAGGWEEEAWYAAYRAAVCSVHLDEWERGSGELLSAWERRPGRAEPLYMLAYFARKRRDSHTAMLAAERALSIPFPGDDRLFVDRQAHLLGPIEEISISAYYTGQKARGAAACDALLHHRATDSRARNLAARNSAYYAEPLATPEMARRVNVPVGLLGTTFSPSTGSIHPTPDGYALINRLVSYYQHTAATVFLARDPGGKYYTRNAWLEFDRDLNELSATLVDDTLVEQRALVPSGDANICGVEDVRLARWNGAWWFTGGTSQYDAQQRPRIVLGRLAPDGPRVDRIVRLRYDGEQMYEKNWVPFVQEGKLFLLYACDPLVILEPDPATGKCREIHRSLPPVDLRHYRGSSQLVRTGNRYLAVVHEAAPTDQGRYYLHRFIEMDRSFRITRASRLFTFWHLGVEYCCGMCLSHGGDELIISFSWEERESWLLSLPRSRVEEMLVPIDHLAFLDPPPEGVAVGPGWLELSRSGGVRLVQDAAQLNGPAAPEQDARQPRRRLWAPRRRRESGSG